MRRGIPSLTALQMFEAAARHGSFTRAADELAVTESAVCRQIAGLEARLGVPLFHRIRKRVVLSPAGTVYAEQVRQRLDEIEQVTLDVMAQRPLGRTIELAIGPTFASQWLVPRLPGLARTLPDLTLNLSARTEPFELADTPFDAAIYYGEGVWPGTEGERLMEEGPSIPVCSPALLGRRKRLEPRQLEALPLLHLTTRLRAWGEWFAGAGLRPPPLRGPRYDLYTMLAQAAAAGLGVALIPRILIAADLQQGRLIAPIPPSGGASSGAEDGPPAKAYYFVHRKGLPAHDPVLQLRDWLRECARAGDVDSLARG
ncbi:LysR substrate-binding domain-containing protein [Cupriavidus sp. AU9028]|uniref:LysR substrate-binding domain-containing protein n=1 Tax=Cupriavidus sp. AU9028 TaxID=2871157 RepID=UPI001C95DC50|nr:LysR substrate-binding domain-containing protein [Cupriavidus sp. AU9028]MBY4895993.1 LysR family transcriptional regulator [Cupriavidus sp. AU9028]